jgi:DNA repair exonuclease SbcCD nuclease subunit
MLTLLHTADWHLGMSFAQFTSEHDRQRLGQARLAVVRRILGLARQYDVDAVLCAGDLFDRPEPDEIWWRGLAEVLDTTQKPIFLLPGNHDPLRDGSVYHPHHPFRHRVGSNIHVIDQPGYTHPLALDAVLYAEPCLSFASDVDHALKLPERAPGDARVRVGMVHGSTFDMQGHGTNFPIAKDAALRRGLDYLAIGDTHAFQRVPGSGGATVYPGAPEPTRFGEDGAGAVAIVRVARGGAPAHVTAERVAFWSWRRETVTSLEILRRLVAESLGTTVLHLITDFDVTARELVEVDELLNLLVGNDARMGRAGVCIIDRACLRVDMSSLELPQAAPGVLLQVRERLSQLSVGEGREARVAQAALLELHRLLARLASSSVEHS